MREPAATPIIRREDRKAIRRSIFLVRPRLRRRGSRALERLLETDAPALQAMLPPGFADAAERYVALLLEANERLNLTRIVEPEAVARLHLLDSLAALPLVDAMAPRRASTSAPAAACRASCSPLPVRTLAWTLVDSVRKKADALRSFVDALGLRT